MFWDYLKPRTGALLVATPSLEDPNFSGTVVYLLDHDNSGTIGVIINRPTSLAVDDALESAPSDHESWGAVLTGDPVLWIGGPVTPQAVVAVGRATEVTTDDRWYEVNGPIGVLALGGGTLSDVGDVTNLRIFAGHAGWEPDQLQNEIDEGSWFVVPANSGDLFTTTPTSLWSEVLSRQGGLFSSATPAPELN